MSLPKGHKRVTEWPTDAETVPTNGARVDFGDDEGKRCPTCTAATGPDYGPYPREWVRIDGIWHAKAD